MPDLSNILNKIPGFDRPQQQPGGPPLPQAGNPGTTPVQKSYPPAPAVKNQTQPTELNITDMKYNALNIDRLKLNIVPRGGFNGVTPDLVIWNYYQYNVKDMEANADEVELSHFVNWSLQELGLKDINIDFHAGGKATITGKYPLMGLPIPFSAEVSSQITADKKLLMTVDEFSAGFKMPGKIRDLLLDLLVSGGKSDPNAPMPDSPSAVFSLMDAMEKVSANQIQLDFTKMKAPARMPITLFETTEQGVHIVGGSDHVAPEKPAQTITQPQLPQLPSLKGLSGIKR